MKNGFTLLEVVTALAVLAMILAGVMRLHILVVRESEMTARHTQALALCEEQLSTLQALPPAHAWLSAGWHMDAGNPLSIPAGRFYRFWEVQSLGGGKKLVSVVAWDGDKPARSFSSSADLAGGRCHRVELAASRP